MSTDDGKKVAAEWVARMQEMREQRDALRDALLSLLPHVECADYKGSDPLTAVEEARAALLGAYR